MVMVYGGILGFFERYNLYSPIRMRYWLVAILLGSMLNLYKNLQIKNVNWKKIFIIADVVVSLLFYILMYYIPQYFGLIKSLIGVIPILFYHYLFLKLLFDSKLGIEKYV